MVSRTADSSRSRRAAVLGAVVAGHLLALAALLATREKLPSPMPKPSALSLIEIDAIPSPPVPPVPPRVPSKLRTPEPESAPTPPAAPEQMANGPSDPSHCTALETLTKAIVDDPVALAAVVNAPPAARSIADAIVMWNAGWSEQAIADDSPLEPVRASVQATLSSVDANCLDQAIAGPRLIPIPVGDRTMFLVFGSGKWSWRELLTPARTDSA